MILRKRQVKVDRIKDWIYSYLLVLLIPLVVCTAVFVYSYSIIWKDIQESNHMVSEVVSSNLDALFEKRIQLLYDLQEDSELTAVLNMQKPLSGEDRYALGRSINDNSLHNTREDLLDGYCIYFPENDIALLQTGYSDGEGIYQQFGIEAGFTREAWDEVMHTRQEDYFYVNKQNQLCAISSLPIRGSRLTMNIIMEFNSWNLERILNSFELMRNSGFVIMDENHQMFLPRNMDGVDIGAVLGEVEVGDTYKTIKAGGQKLSVLAVQSESSSLTYISVIQYREFWEKAIRSLIYFVLAFIACLLLGFILSYSLAFQKEKTYGALMRVVDEKVSIKNPTKYRNKMVASAVEHIAQEYDDMQKQLLSYSGMKKNLLLSNILDGTIPEDEVADVLRDGGLYFADGRYSVILFGFSSIERFFDEGKDELDPSDMKLLKDGIIAILEEMIQSRFVCEVLDLKGKVVCIINFGNLSMEECYAELSALVNSAKKIIQSGLYISLTIAISSVHEDVMEMNRAYSEALKVMEYQHLFGAEDIVNYSDMLSGIDSVYLYSSDDELNWMNQIKAGNAARALAIMDRIYQENVMTNQNSVDLLKYLLYDMAATLLKVEFELKNRLESKENKMYLTQMDRAASIDEMKEILVKWTKDICDRVYHMNYNSTNSNALAESIVAYLETHYSNPDLNSTMIAEEFHINSIYLSSFFREKIGVNLLSYLHQLRIGKAKELLRETQMTILEISKRVGCNNSITLNRMFKKMEGMTPTEYRNRSKRED